MKKKNEISIKAVRKIEHYLDTHLQLKFDGQKAWKVMDNASRKKFRQAFRRIIEEAIGTSMDTLDGQTVKPEPKFELPPKASKTIKRYHDSVFGNFSNGAYKYWIEVDTKTNLISLVYEDGIRINSYCPMTQAVLDCIKSGVWVEF